MKLGKTGRSLARRNHRNAMKRAKELAPIIREMRERGLSLQKIADEFNTRSIPTARSGSNRWYPPTVFRLIKRIGQE